MIELVLDSRESNFLDNQIVDRGRKTIIKFFSLVHPSFKNISQIYIHPNLYKTNLYIYIYNLQHALPIVKGMGDNYFISISFLSSMCACTYVCTYVCMVTFSIVS